MDATTSSFPIYPSAIILAAFSLLNILLDIPPFIFHIRAQNVAAGSLVLWILLMNTSDLINALLWPTDNVSEWFNGIGLCDVEVKLFVGAQVGQTGALICIMQDLARLLDTDNVTLGRTDTEEKRRKAWELVMCWGMPILLMLCHYVVQPARYAIFGISGCTIMIDNSWLAVVLVQIWPVIFILTAVYYSGVVVYRIHRYRKQFSSLLSTSNTNKARFIRLFIMSLILTLAFLPLALYAFYYNVNVLHHRFSWQAVHNSEAWTKIIMVPSYGGVIIDHWTRVATGIVVFLFFGMGDEAMQMYRAALLTVGLGRIFPRLKKERNPTSSTGSMSSFGSRAKLFIKDKLSRKNTTATESIIETRASGSEKLSSPMSSKAKTWYMRIFHRRCQEDDDPGMQLPVWNPSCAVHPNSADSTIRSMSDGSKGMAESAPSPSKSTAATHSFELDIEREFRKM